MDTRRKVIIVDPDFHPDDDGAIQIIILLAVIIGSAAGVLIWVIGL